PEANKGIQVDCKYRPCNLENLRNDIFAVFKTPALENPAVVFNIMNDGDRYSPRNDVSFREILRLLISKSSLKFTVFIETPSKPFNEWTFPKV
ncbi:8104_t:CDS:1, partial [Ambispora leptoticha]